MNRHEFVADIQFSDAGEDASILQRLVCAREFLNGPFIAHYGDTFLDFDPLRLQRAHLMNGARMTLVYGNQSSPFGELSLQGDTVVSFVEKPRHHRF